MLCGRRRLFQSASDRDSNGRINSHTVNAVESWTTRLEDAINTTAIFDRVYVLAEVGSTQDVIRQQTMSPGSVVVALQQTGGRGRHGRSWADTGQHGLAMSCSLSGESPDRAWRLATLAALATADAIESRCEVSEKFQHADDARHPLVQIKWPNDLYMQSKKVGGILIEQNAGVAIVGIGVNVSQSSWPPKLADSATSLKQVGFTIDRLALAVALIGRIGRWQAMDDATLQAGFGNRDGLAGRDVEVLCDQKRIKGRCCSIDPSSHLEIETDQGIERVPVATSRIVAASGLAISK